VLANTENLTAGRTLTLTVNNAAAHISLSATDDGGRLHHRGRQSASR
jgi:hypothetical protein